MRKNTTCLFLFSSLLSISGMAENRKDSTQVGRNYVIDEVVVTGTRNETDIRHLPMTISIVNRQQIEKRYEPSLLPLLTEQVPGVVYYQSWYYGIWCVYRCSRWHEFTGDWW